MLKLGCHACFFRSDQQKAASVTAKATRGLPDSMACQGLPADIRNAGVPSAKWTMKRVHAGIFVAGRNEEPQFDKEGEVVKKCRFDDETTACNQLA